MSSIPPSDQRKKKPIMSTSTTSCSRTPSSTSLASRRLPSQAHRPALARRPHYGTGSNSNSKPWLRIFNRPTVILESILLNLPIPSLIIAMHVSKTWLHVACESSRIRRKLFLWHVKHVVDTGTSSPLSGLPIAASKDFEIFPKNLKEGLLITCRIQRNAEYFVLLKNHCENRSLQLLDSRKIKVTLDPLTGKFFVKWYDHSSKLIIDTVLAPYSIPFRCKQPDITGDRLFKCFKMYHSPEGLDWAILLESMTTRTPLEKAESGEVSLRERTAFTLGLMKALRRLRV